MSGLAADTVPLLHSALPLAVDSAHQIKLPLDLVHPEESDVRHEPAPPQLDPAMFDASTRSHSEHATANPNHYSHPAPPKVEDPGASDPMDLDASPTNARPNGVNGHAHVHTKSPRPRDEEDADTCDPDHPAAKRVRTHSDADQASVNYTSQPATPPDTATYANGTATPVPDTPMAESSVDGTATSPMDVPGPAVDAGAPGPSVSVSTFPPNLWRYATSVLKRLKAQKDAAPFLLPVDPVALNIPHYPSIIKNPMDINTVERKMQSSNPNKPDPNFANPRYSSWDEFVADVRLVFSNCLTFNGPDHAITKMAQKLEETFEKSLKNMPQPQLPKVPLVKKASPTPPPPKKTAPPRRASTSLPTIRRNEAEGAGRPKREIHPPPSKDLPYADAPRSKRRVRASKKNDPNGEQLKFCNKLLAELHKKQYWNIANPFYDPVDWQKLNLPSYPKLVKKPMDLSTIRRKLENYEYPDAESFRRDFALMINNCFTFNPAGTPVNQAGVELDRLFHEKWKALPQLNPAGQSEDEEEEETDDEAVQNAQKIALMESQIAMMNQSLADLKNKNSVPKPKEKKAKKEKKDKPLPHPASSSKSSGKTKSSGKKSRKSVVDDDVLSFEQKKALSETIQTLDGTKLEKVITIIHEGVPEIRDSTEEIELDIDSLPASVLTKLYNFVLRPLKKEQHQPTKRNRPGPGTGGLKRKSMDETAEAEKIRALEDRLRMFDPDAVPASSSAPPNRRANGATEQSSDSSSDSDSSGSDSE